MLNISTRFYGYKMSSLHTLLSAEELHLNNNVTDVIKTYLKADGTT